MSQNIQIAVRVRPQNKRESGQYCLVKMKDNQITLKNPQNKNLENFLQKNQTEKEEKTFQFNHCYWSYDDCQQKQKKNIDVYKDIGEQLIKNIFEGYNSTLFAYGQTGTGKSFTIEGQNDENGLLQLCLIDIFKKKTENENQNIDTKVFISYLEIYNEDMKDLLDPRKKNLRIFSTSEGVVIQNLSGLFCENVQQVLNLLQEGKKIRAVGSHNMNINSSRSHALFMINLVQKDKGQIKIAKLNIVDLAGSERQSKTQSDDQRQHEASNINKSLTFLGLVIENLAQNQLKGSNLHIPYRNSNLTHILSESLSGNSKTFMIATISAAEENHEETLGTLRFAERVQVIKTNSKQNIAENEVKKVQTLKQEIDKMRQQIERLTIQNQKIQKPEFQEKQYLEEQKEGLEQILKNYQQTLMDKLSILDYEKNQKIELDNHRNQLLKDAGVQIFSGDDQQFGKDTPYLMNVSDDPSLTGCLLFYLKQGENLFGTSKECDISLNGIGIRKKHCVIQNNKNEKLTIQVLYDARIILNGAILETNSTKQISINHLDRIQLGYDHQFKLIIPKNKKKQTNDIVLPVEDFLKGRLSQSDDQAQQLKQFIEEIKSKLSQTQFNSFLDEIYKALENIEKANEITLFRYRKFPLKANNIVFGLQLLTPLISLNGKIEICVIIKNRDRNQEQHYWTYGRFIQRLEEMHQWYQHEEIPVDKYENQDPWSYFERKLDLNKMNIKQLYKHYYGEVKYFIQKIQELLNQQEKLVRQIQRQSANLRLEIRENDIQSFCDTYFREIDNVKPSEKVQKMKLIPQINIQIQQYAEIGAQLSEAQELQFEAQNQIDKILQNHKKKSSKNSENIRQKGMTDEQNQISTQIQQQFQYQQQIIPSQLKTIQQLQQKINQIQQQKETLNIK